jgi:hypothetical protein
MGAGSWGWHTLDFEDDEDEDENEAAAWLLAIGCWSFARSALGVAEE